MILTAAQMLEAYAQLVVGAMSSDQTVPTGKPAAEGRAGAWSLQAVVTFVAQLGISLLLQYCWCLSLECIAPTSF